MSAALLTMIDEKEAEVAVLRKALKDALDVVSNEDTTPDYRRAELRFLKIRLTSALAPKEATHPKA